MHVELTNGCIYAETCGTEKQISAFSAFRCICCRSKAAIDRWGGMVRLVPHSRPLCNQQRTSAFRPSCRLSSPLLTGLRRLPER